MTFKKLKFVLSLLFRRQFIVIYFPGHEETEWMSFGLDIEQVGDACLDVEDNISDIIDDYIACEDAEDIGDRMIDMINLN